MRKFREEEHKYVAYAILATLIVFLGVTIGVPFAKNSLQGGDLPGHLAAAEYIRDVLWPSPIGWDYRYFGGYPLNQFYAPMFAWVVATLGFALSLTIALKAIVLLSLFATPLSMYYCARKFGFDCLAASVAAVAGCALLFIDYGIMFYGSDFKSIFLLGQVANGLATPLLFSIWGWSIQNSCKESMVRHLWSWLH